MLRRSKKFTSAQLRRKRRKIFAARSAVVLCAGGILWAAAFWFSGHPAFTIRNVEVFGTVSVSSEKIASTTSTFLSGRYFLTVPKNNILFYPKRAIEERLAESFPELASVAVGFKDFTTIGVRVVERAPVALWCAPQADDDSTGEHCYFVEASGLIFSLASTTGSLTRFSTPLHRDTPLGQQVLPESRFKEFSRFAEKLAEIGFPVSAFRARSDGDSDVALYNKVRLIVGKDASFDEAFGNFLTVLSEEVMGEISGLSQVDYIDLRFGNKVFYKLK